jgi:hypothetical protein
MWELVVFLIAAYFVYNLDSIHVEFRPKGVKSSGNQRVAARRPIEK